MASPAEWIDLVIARAVDLRRVGVARISIEGCVVDLLPTDEAAAVAAEPSAEDKATEPTDPLEDPWTFGGRVPSISDTMGE